MTFNIDAAGLAVVLPFASTDKSRPVLNTVALLPGGRICATDGVTLGLYQEGHDAELDAVPNREVLIAVTPELKRLVRAANAKAMYPTLSVELIYDSTSARISTPIASIRVPTVGGPYPRIANIFPWGAEPLPLAKVYISGEQMARFGSKARVTFYGENRCMVVRTPDERFIGLLMPLRPDTVPDDDTLPEWIREPVSSGSV
jgi:hypothetical protein